MKESIPGSPEANEEARKKLEGMLSKEERIQRGLIGSDLGPDDLSELSDPALESNLNLLLEIENIIQEWEQRFASYRSLPEAESRKKLDLLYKEILKRYQGMADSVNNILRFGGEHEKSELRRLNARITELKGKIFESTNSEKPSFEF